MKFKGGASQVLIIIIFKTKKNFKNYYSDKRAEVYQDTKLEKNIKKKKKSGTRIKSFGVKLTQFQRDIRYNMISNSNVVYKMRGKSMTKGETISFINFFAREEPSFFLAEYRYSVLSAAGGC